MLISFPGITTPLSVGTAGAVPGVEAVYFGDIVVSEHIVEHDIIASERTEIHTRPKVAVQKAVSGLRASYATSWARVKAIIDDVLTHKPGMGTSKRPTEDSLRSHGHESRNENRFAGENPRPSNTATIHHGSMASGLLHGSSAETTMMSEAFGLLCFDIKLSKLTNDCGCLVIRGVCDFENPPKVTDWKPYAALVAAAYAKMLIQEIPESELRANLQTIPTRSAQLLQSMASNVSNTRLQAINSPMRKTCEWILSAPFYTDWLDLRKYSDHQGLLVINGSPAVGKSVLLKFMYLHARKTYEPPGETAVVAFFFNERGENLERSALGLYQSFLVDTLRRFPDLQELLDEYVTGDAGDLSGDGKIASNPNLLKQIVQKVVQSLGSRKLIWFIDAIDECDETQIKDFVGFLHVLREIASVKQLQFFTCVSSRHYPHIWFGGGHRTTLEDQKGHVMDVETYINTNLKAENLKVSFLERAGGVFYWAVLMVHWANKEYQRGQNAAGLVYRLHTSWREVLREIIQRSHNKEVLLRCIQWLLFARRPLSPEEFVHAVLPGDGSQHHGLTTDTINFGDNVEMLVRESSAGLAEVSIDSKTSRPVVQFFHPTISDSLLMGSALRESWPQLRFHLGGQVHQQLSLYCNSYLDKCFPEMEKHYSKSTLEKRYPLAEYACHNVLYHEDRAAYGPFGPQFSPNEFRLPDWIRIHSVLQGRRPRDFETDASLLYILAHEGFSTLIRMWFSYQGHAPSPEQRYVYHLFAAMVNGHKDSVAAILNLDSPIFEGVDIMEGLDNGEYLGIVDRTPLSWAAQKGRLTILRLLLRNGCPLDEKDPKGLTPLSRAIINGHWAICQLLLDSGAHVDPLDEPDLIMHFGSIGEARGAIPAAKE